MASAAFGLASATGAASFFAGSDPESVFAPVVDSGLAPDAPSALASAGSLDSLGSERRFRLSVR